VLWKSERTGLKEILNWFVVRESRDEKRRSAFATGSTISEQGRKIREPTGGGFFLGKKGKEGMGAEIQRARLLLVLKVGIVEKVQGLPEGESWVRDTPLGRGHKLG